MNKQTISAGIHHLGLTLPDIDAAKAFFIEALGFAQVGEVPDYPAFFIGNGSVMLTLWRAEDPATANPFDRRKNIGLHHFALQVTDVDALYSELRKREDVQIEFQPEPLGNTAIRHMMVRVPGNVRLELIQP